MEGYNARTLAASYASVWDAYRHAVLARAKDISEAVQTLLEALDPVPESTYRDEAEAVGLHPPRLGA